jgi:hypothetical protein
MNRIFWAILLLLPAPVVRAFDDYEDGPAAEGYKIEVEVRRWQPGLDMFVQKSPTGSEGTLIDLPNDLGVEDKGTFHVRGTVQIGPGHKVRLSWTPLDYRGDENVERTIVFGGSTYEVDTRIVSRIKGNYYTLEYEGDFARGEWGHVGLLIGAKAFDGDTVLVAPDIGDRKITSIHVPVPVLGVTSRLYFGKLSAAAEFSGLTIGKKGHIWELELSGRFDLVKNLSGSLGFRRLSLHGEHEEDLLEYKMKGLFLGVAARF